MDKDYSRSFREKLGFTNKQELQKFFKATDFTIVNWDKIEKCNFAYGIYVVHFCIRFCINFFVFTFSVQFTKKSHNYKLLA